MSSPYDVLGIDKTASDQDVKRAYRALTLKYHPDRNPSPEAEAKIREINEAYAVLSDPQKRRQVDRVPPAEFGESPLDIFQMLFGHHGPEMAFFQQQHRFGGPGGPSFGHPPPPFGYTQHVPAIHQSITLTMDQAYCGCTLPMEIDRWVLHEGNMKVRELETVYVDIPPGIDESEMLILPEKGNVMNDQCKGVVKVKMTIENTTAFRRQGMDLIYSKTLSLKEALCGFHFELKHLNGKTLSMNNTQKVTIIKPRFRKMVPGYGMIRDKNVGSLIIEFDVSFPDELTPEQIDTLRATLP